MLVEDMNQVSEAKEMEPSNVNKPLCEQNLIESVSSEKLESGTFLSVSERYYEQKYCLEIPNICESVRQKVSFHSNRVCLISLAENHPLMSEDKEIVKVNFKISEKLDRLQNKVSGKSKRGAQKLRKDSILCYIECSDGTKCPVYSCIDGKLLEINDKLIVNPNLLKTKPDQDGYIALLLPILNIYQDLKDSMLTKEQYFR